ncbi:MAG: thioredoxin domain-containing protein [Flavobacteriales bacterium]|nr:thioredoxin domain-containing protein [Flavobacteriales bacterium]
MSQATNRLALESSPYLQQHAHNPVDWYPWCDAAFAKAKELDRLVLVSIGYSSCHWCHVMERESFMDEEVARSMNDHFICIKVDREERPDVDQVYMRAVQLMTNRGGWPLNCFTLPDGRPVYGGTYFTREQWMQVLRQLARTYADEPERVRDQAERLHQGLSGPGIIPPAADRAADHRSTLHAMVANWRTRFDAVDGGADNVPKFPMPDNYRFLLRFARLTADNGLERHVELTLDRMALGGLFDQVGGGFARYSTDAFWRVPHFEKMLYDNALLVSLYAQAYQALRKPLYKETVERTLAFIDREMTSAEGAFYSALDADSEGEEGRFYVWTEAELEQVLGSEFEFARTYFDIGPRTLWELDRHILTRKVDDERFALQQGIPLIEVKQRVASITERLLHAREQRPRPGLDDKSLTSWNALMVTALCDAYEVLGDQRYRAAAVRAMDLLLNNCRRSNGGLWHLYKEGKATINGFLEDHAFCIEALIALYGITFEESWLQHARSLTEHVIRHYHDGGNGLFHFTSDQDPALITRPVEVHDNVIPASNSSLSNSLLILGTLFDDERYLGLSERALRAGTGQLVQYPTAHSHWAQGLLLRAFPLNEIAITGPGALNLRKGFAPHYIPNRLFLGSTQRSDLPLLKDKLLPDDTIFVCVERSCQLPVNTVEAALPLIQ